MMCDFITRTNWSNIKSNYFVNTIIIFNHSYYTNITSTVTFVNHLTLCRAFLFFSPKYARTSPVPSSTSIRTCLIFSQKFLTAPTSLTMWSGWPSFKTNRLYSHTALWIILAVTGICVCSPLFKTPLSTVVLDGFLLSMKGLSSTNWSPSQWFFFSTWCDEWCCRAQLHPSNRGRWFFEWRLFLRQAHHYRKWVSATCRLEWHYQSNKKLWHVV